MWAVLVAAPGGAADVRFQDDVLAQYRILRRGGVPDDRIVLVGRGSLLRRNARVDYGSASVRDLRGVFRRVVAAAAGDRVYVYIVGHGDARGVRFGARTWLTPLDLRVALAGGRYSHALVAVDACDSGVFGRAALPRVAILTASRADESSFASRRDPATGKWLGDEFSDALARVARSEGSLSLAQAYARIMTAVWSSHPQLYGDPAGVRLADFFSR